MSEVFHSGWEYDAAKIAAAIERMEQAGCQTSFAAAAPALQGHWRRLIANGVKGVFAQDDELKVLGHHRPTNEQSRGTCVWQGTSRAAEDVHISRLADRVIVGRYALLAYEVGYGGCRQKFGWPRSHDWGCQCRRCPDGLVGANAAEWLATVGIIERGVYGGTDLTRPREDLAIGWGNSGGIPEQAINAGKRHLFNAHRAKSLDEFLDGLSTKIWGAVCLPFFFDGSSHDADGYCLPTGEGGHCTEACAVLQDPDLKDAMGFQQSWTLRACRFPKTVRYAGGVKEMRPGAYCVRRSTIERYFDQGEFWLIDLPGANSFR